MRFLRAIPGLLVMVAMAWGWVLKPYFAEKHSDYAASAKTRIAVAIGAAINDLVNKGAPVSVVTQAHELLTFFEDRFAIGQKGGCSVAPCYQFDVGMLSDANGQPVLARWQQGVLTVNSLTSLRDGFAIYLVLEEIYKAWGEDMGRFTIPSPRNDADQASQQHAGDAEAATTVVVPQINVPMPWETQPRVFVANAANVLSQGAYHRKLEDLAQAAILGKGSLPDGHDGGFAGRAIFPDTDPAHAGPAIEFTKKGEIIFTNCPEEIFKIFSAGDRTLSPTSRQAIAEQLVIDLNRQIIRQHSASPAEGMENLFSNYIHARDE